MIKLSQKDRKILAILSINARATYSQIGVKTRMHKDTVAYRIKQLEKNSIIYGYTAFFDYSLLGYRVYKIYIKFKGLKHEDHEQIIDYLKKQKNVGWLAEGNGSWDMIIGVNEYNVQDFYTLKLAFESKFSYNIAEISTSTQIQAYFYPRTYIYPSHREEVILYSNRKNIVIDKKDKDILTELAVNSRNSIINIADKTKLSVRTVGYRINQLEKRKVILQCRASINLEKINHIFIKAFIKLHDITTETRRKILLFFRQNNNVVHNVESLGEWELEPEFEIENISEFHRILNEFRVRFSSNIIRIDSMIINKEHKYRYVP